MSCATQVFTVTPGQFAEIQAQAAAKGLQLATDSGTCEHSGVTVQYAYDATAQTLSLTVLSKPFIVSCGMVNGKLHDLIDGILNEGPKQP